MKVLNVISSLNQELGGGTAERSVQMSYFQNQAGIECSILTINQGIDDTLVEYLSGVEIVALPYISSRFHIPVPMIGTIARLVRAADVVHLINHWSVLNVFVYLCIKLFSKPYVVCPAGALEKFGRSIYLKSFYNWIVGRNIIRGASRCVAITQDEVIQFSQYDVHPEDVVVISNGVVTEPPLPSKDDNFRIKHGLGTKPYILFMGRLNLIKGPDLLVDAFCRWHKEEPSGYQLVLAGTDGGLLSGLQNKIDSANLNDVVHFIGFLSGEEKRQAYSSAELLVIPSRSEAMSIVVLEAGVLGTPMLATDKCGLNDFADLKCGWICSATSEGIYSGLAEFSTADDKVLRGQNLKLYVLDNYDWSKLISKYSELYQTII
ncbi:glycosyltransferase [Amylibacter sp.]|nr:glycosyltransferase [Amylibacter sp.]